MIISLHILVRLLSKHVPRTRLPLFACILSSESESNGSDNASPRSSVDDDDDGNGNGDDDDEVLAINDIKVGDFALVRYKYSHSIKHYIGECMEKENNGDISLIFLDRVCGSLFKYRENVVRETANINMVKNILAALSLTQRGGKLDFKSSTDVID